MRAIALRPPPRRTTSHLVDGGRHVPRAPDPRRRSRLLSLPPLTRAGGRLVAPTGGSAVAAVLAERADVLAEAVERSGPTSCSSTTTRSASGSSEPEIAAAIDAARAQQPERRAVVCSLRDIVRQTRYEHGRAGDVRRPGAGARCSDRFDGLLVHADPDFTRLEEHFTRAADLPLRSVYTGFVIAWRRRSASPSRRRRMRY